MSVPPEKMRIDPIIGAGLWRTRTTPRNPDLCRTVRRGPTSRPLTGYHARTRRMSRSAVAASRHLGLVLCLCLALPPMRISAQTPDGIAVILGGQAHEYPVRFRQSPDLYYLTGLVEPGLVLVLNGVTKHASVFALKRPKFGPPSPTPDLRDAAQPV